jgi:hypothetical protein
MLNCNVDNLLLEADAAISVRDAQLRELKNLTSLFTGPYSHAKSNEEWPDNFVFQYLSFALPKTAYNNPRFKFKSSQTVPQHMIESIREKMDMADEAALMGMADPIMVQQFAMQANGMIEKLERPRQIAEAMQWGMNQWMNSSGPDDDVLTFVANCLMMYGVMKTTQVTKKGVRLPKWECVSPRRFGFDPLCMMFGAARYCFQQVIEDKDSLIARAKADPEGKWDIGAIEALGEDTGAEEIRQQETTTTAGSGTPKRGEVAYYEYWVNENLPESFGPDEGFNGTIYTVAKNAGNYLRDPVPYYGPAWGPYCLGGVYPVPDSPFPLSPIMANYSQARDHNDQVRAAMAGAKSYKRIVFVPAGNPDVARQLKDAPHDLVIPIKGLKKDEVIAIEIGGVTDQQLQQVAFSREILRRSSGMTENAVSQQEGGGVGKSTATEAALISEGSETRMAFVQQRIGHALCRAGRTAAWFMYHDKKSVVKLGEEAAEQLEMLMPVFMGGHDPNEGDDFDDLGMEIDVMSMPWSGQNQEKQNAIALLDQVVKVAPLVTTCPAIDWQDILNRTGDAFNESDLGEVIDDEIAQQQMMMQEQAAMGEMQGQQQEMGMQGEQHREKVKTEQAKRGAIRTGARDKSRIASATVKEKALKGRSYGARSGAKRKPKRKKR